MHWISHIQCSQYIPFDAFGEISARANNSYALTSVLWRISYGCIEFFLHIQSSTGIAAYPVDNAIQPLNGSDLIG